jgi:two-component system LytT family response regulator
MIRVLVVDDEALARDGVRARLAEHQDMSWVGEAEDGPAALRAMAALRPDLVFMDVQMPGMNGIEALRGLSPNERPGIILLTAYDNFAVTAFELNALDYLLKPIDDQRFGEALDRMRTAYRHRQAGSEADPSRHWAQRFTVRTGRRKALVEASDIDWIEAHDDYVGLHVGERMYLLRESLHRLNLRLDPKLFIRIHRSIIVRIDRIVEFEALPNRDCVVLLANGKPLRASRTYADHLRAVLAEAR